MPTRDGRRTLICIAIAHTMEDMGSLGKRLRAGKAYLRAARARWAEIQQQVQALSLDWLSVKVYQDGLPDADVEIVRKILDEVQSPNYDLLRWLAAQGTEIIGTESPSLMKEEYDHLVAALTAKGASARAAARDVYSERAAALLDERDAYIARRIDKTLPPGGVGILFIGQAHQVAAHLSPDIAPESLRR